MARSSLPRTGWLQHAPMALFILLTSSGVGFIWWAKLSGLSTVMVTAIPVALMFVYLAISLIANGLRLHNEQAGDNLYYMGFLFTLSSLGVSLFRFSVGTAIDEIVRNFGIAVTSTIFGIAFRILFNQMRRDPLDIERNVRHELAEMTRRVRSELDSSSREFSSYRRSSSQMLVEGFEEIGRQAERTGEAIQKAIESLSKESIKPIREAAETLATLSQQNQALFEERSRKVNASADEAAERLATTTTRITGYVDGFARTVEEMSAKLRNMAAPEEMLRVQLQPSLDAIREMGDQQRALSAENAARLDAQAAGTVKALAPLSELPGRFGHALGPLTSLPDQIRNGFTPIDESAKQLSQVVANLSSVVDRLSKVADRLAANVVSQPRYSSSDILPDRQAAFTFPERQHQMPVPLPEPPARRPEEPPSKEPTIEPTEVKPLDAAQLTEPAMDKEPAQRSRFKWW